MRRILSPCRRAFPRINVKVKAQEESEINGRGPEIGPKELEAL